MRDLFLLVFVKIPPKKLHINLPLNKALLRCEDLYRDSLVAPVGPQAGAVMKCL